MLKNIVLILAFLFYSINSQAECSKKIDIDIFQSKNVANENNIVVNLNNKEFAILTVKGHLDDPNIEAEIKRWFDLIIKKACR